MARPGILKRVRPGWLLGASILLLVGLVAVATQSPFDAERGQVTSISAERPASASQDVTPRAVGGMKAYRDPVTGERVGPPPRAMPSPMTEAQRSSLSRSDVGLKAVLLRPEIRVQLR